MLTSFLHSDPFADFSRYPMLLGVWVTMIWLAGAHECRPSAISFHRLKPARSIRKKCRTDRNTPIRTAVPISCLLHQYNIREGPD